METQNVNNHTRWVPLYHFVTFGLLLVLLIASAALFFMPKFVVNDRPHLIITVGFFLFGIALVLTTYFARNFALKVQDRAIRAEENLRYFILTGKRMDQRITMKQIIALRFASDDEFGELVDKAAAEGLSPGAIKKSIKTWRADNFRA